MNKKNYLLAFSVGLVICTSCGSLKKGNTTNPDFIQVGVGTQIVEKPQIIVGSDAQADSVVKEMAPASTLKYYKELQGEWTIVSVFNKKIDLEEMPFLNFDTEADKLYGNSGCNVINAGLVFDRKERTMHFDNLLNTLMACPNIKVESMINSALGKTTSYNFTSNNGISYLNLRDSHNTVVMTLKRHNLDILNGAWTVKYIDGKKINSTQNGNAIELVLDVEEAKLHGNTGCNIVNGTIVYDPKKDYAVQFANLISTLKSCPEMATETALLVALEEVEFYKKKSSSEIELLSKDKKPLVLLKRLPLMK